MAINIEHLSKAYQLYRQPADRLKELLTAGRRSYHIDFWALRDVSFDVRKGSTVGIVGRNGSGKSTLLQLIAGTVRPTAGVVHAEGRVSALLELGTGFNPEFTGRENVLMNGAILGYSPREMRERLPRIVEFAEIGPFIDRPVKTYSSGMQVRLAFATSINVDPDILIVDEALAVGDVAFQHRCMRRIHELRDSGVTVLFVSHSPEAVKMLCDEAVLLEEGSVVKHGSADDVVNDYLSLMFGNRPLAASVPMIDLGRITQSGANALEVDRAGAQVVSGLERWDRRYGNGTAEVIGLETYDEGGVPARRFLHGSRMIVKVSARFLQDVPRPLIGITLRNSTGVDVTRTNTHVEGAPLPAARPGDVYTSQFDLRLPYLLPGSYTISPAVANGTSDDFQMCDWVDNALLIYITARYEVHGQVRFPGSAKTYRTPAPQVQDRGSVLLETAH